jgi:hypothetical protein
VPAALDVRDELHVAADRELGRGGRRGGAGRGGAGRGGAGDLRGRQALGT